MPAWLQVSLGIGAEGMFGARSNIAKDKFGNIIFDRSDIQRYRQWYLAPDIDLTKIKTNKKGHSYFTEFAERNKVSCTCAGIQ